MPKSDKRGAPPQFPYSVAEITDKFEHCKAEYEFCYLENKRWTDFFIVNDISIEEDKETIINPVNSNILL